MYNHSQQFVLKRLSELFGILLHPVKTDQNTTGNHISHTLVKGDNICISVVIQKSIVSHKHVFIIAKDVRNATRDLTLFAYDLLQPKLMGQRRFEGTFDYVIKGNHNQRTIENLV
jgi:hypothetical protein